MHDGGHSNHQFITPYVTVRLSKSAIAPARENPNSRRTCKPDTCMDAKENTESHHLMMSNMIVFLASAQAFFFLSMSALPEENKVPDDFAVRCWWHASNFVTGSSTNVAVLLARGGHVSLQRPRKRTVGPSIALSFANKSDTLFYSCYIGEQIGCTSSLSPL